MIDVQAIRTHYPIADAARSAGLELRRSGRRLVGCCPFHRDDHPSFTVYPDTRSFFCFGCHAGGDVIDFVARLHGMSFREAVMLVARRPPSRSSERRATAPARAPHAITSRERDILEAALRYFEGELRASPSAREYLASRGIGTGTVARHRLGLGSDGLAYALAIARPDRAVAEELGLLTGTRSAFAGRIVIPELTADGRPAWLTGRAVGAAGPRYLNLRLPKPLLGLTAAHAAQASAVIVTEGPFDWLTACDWGLRAVALLGTHVPRTTLAALRAFDRVYLALDADSAGRTAAASLASALGARALVVHLPAGVHDLNQLGQQGGGRDAFLDALRAAHTRTEIPWNSAPDHPARAA